MCFPRWARARRAAARQSAAIRCPRARAGCLGLASGCWPWRRRPGAWRSAAHAAAHARHCEAAGQGPGAALTAPGAGRASDCCRYGGSRFAGAYTRCLRRASSHLSCKVHARARARARDARRGRALLNRAARGPGPGAPLQAAGGAGPGGVVLNQVVATEQNASLQRVSAAVKHGTQGQRRLSESAPPAAPPRAPAPGSHRRRR